MSERNGDRARFGRARKRKALQRERNREMRRAELPAIHLSTQRMSALGWHVDATAKGDPHLLDARTAEPS